MLRFLTFLFNKPYEVCRSCATLREQLEYERANNKELQNTLINILKPQITEAPVVEIGAIESRSTLFSKRRAAMEEKDRLAASIARSSKNLALPDKPDEKIEQLEKELGITEG